MKDKEEKDRKVFLSPYNNLMFKPDHTVHGVKINFNLDRIE